MIRQDDDGGDFGGDINDGKAIGDMKIGHLNGYLIVAEALTPTSCMLLTANTGVPQFGIRRNSVEEASAVSWHVCGMF